MKKYVVFIAFMGILLFGCSENDANSSQKYAGLLSSEKGNYALYIVANSNNEITNETLINEEIHNVKSWTQEISLVNARLDEVVEIPTFMVFDTEEKVYETHSRQELLEFLKRNQK